MNFTGFLLSIDSRKYIHPPGVAENGITVSSTVTNTQQNMASLTYDRAPLAPAAEGPAPALPADVAAGLAALTNATLPLVPLLPLVATAVEVGFATWDFLVSSRLISRRGWNFLKNYIKMKEFGITRIFIQKSSKLRGFNEY